jgi:hypothetical protein
MKPISSAAQISAIFFAIRQTNLSDSITQGPRINAGSLPPMTTLPTRNGFAFSLITYSACHPEPRKLSGRGISQIAQNITQTIECDQPPSERFLALLGMTTLLLNGSSIASHKIDNGKWCVQSEKK